MAVRERYDNSVLVERWSNGTTPGSDPTGYYSGAPVTFQRPLTSDEAAFLAALDSSQTQAANQATLQAKAQSALTANATFLAQTKPATAAVQASQAYDQAVTLTRECSALIRLALNLLDSVNGT